MRKTVRLLLLLLTLPALAQAQTTVEISGSITGTVTWTNDTEYILVNKVYVEDGATLTIEPGTVIKGRFNSDPSQAAALVVQRGGKLYAEGTPTQPIIFTAEDDDVNDPEDLDLTDRGLWGGVILLGKARTNVAGGENNIEGLPATEGRGTYGCDMGSGSGVVCDDDDDSGVFRYVSIRHGGTSIAANNEINGLTLGAVGRGTVIEYVEVFANLDDGYEWFGGTVDTKYLAAIGVGDDAFDYDEGFRGRGQFWFSLHFADDAGSGGEHDGGTDPEDGQPYAVPVVYNATLIGSGVSGVASNDWALNLRDNAGGMYFNSIFTDFTGKAISVEDQAPATIAEDSWARFLADELRLENNLFWAFGGAEGDDLFTVRNSSGVTQAASDATFDTYMNTHNAFADPMLHGLCRTANACLDPRPASDGPAYQNLATYTDDFFTPVPFKGAFGGENWLHGWTAAFAYGLLTEDSGLPNEDAPAMPATALLLGNHPNPFSGTTTITFELDRARPVTLRVYDVLGREVARLVEGIQPAGQTTVSFNASALPSGTYLYQLHTDNDLAASKRMVVVK